MPALRDRRRSHGRKGLYKCAACREQFTVTVGTIFEDSHIPLNKRLLAIHLMCASEKGMSARQLHRMLGITYKSAWSMCHPIRYAMTQEPLSSKLGENGGPVEIDETYIGGKEKGTGRRGSPRQHSKKHAAAALVERAGNATFDEAVTDLLKVIRHQSRRSRRRAFAGCFRKRGWIDLAGTRKQSHCLLSQSRGPHSAAACDKCVVSADGDQRRSALGLLNIIEDGPAHRAGVKAGDVLDSCDGKLAEPPNSPRFQLGGTHELQLGEIEGSGTRSVRAEVPNRAAKDLPPMIEPKSIYVSCCRSRDRRDPGGKLLVLWVSASRERSIMLAKLQKFLERKTASGLSYSVVDHLRWDLSSMFDMAVSEQVITANPTASLYTPKAAKRSEGYAMSAEQVEVALGAVEDREKVILRLAIFAGMRPGELLAIQRDHVKKDASVIEIRHRVYRGKFASPKNGLVRTVAVPPSTATLLRQWMENAVEPKPESFLFAGETGQPLWRSSLLDDYIKAKLDPVGLGWVNFQVMRRTHASLGHQKRRLIRRFRRPTRTRHRGSARCLHQVEHEGSGDCCQEA